MTEAVEAAKPKKTPITMDDQTIAEFGDKEKMQLEVTVNPDFSATAKALFRTGKILTTSIPAKLAARALAHGLTQKIRDSIAGDKTVEDALASVEDVTAALASGEWNQAREAASTGPKGNTLELIAAIAKVRKLDPTKVADWLGARTPVEKTKLRNVPEIALEIAKARAAKAKQAPASEGATDPFDGLAT